MSRIFTLAALAGVAGASGSALAACRAISPGSTQVLVELYTSQGCSSCPPADRWLTQFDPQAAPGVVPLSLHVGYWDYIGWKDPYARREFNARQQWLAGLNRNRTVYTPGVFVQGRETPQWHRVGTFEAAARSIAAQPARARIELDVESGSAGTVGVRAATSILDGQAHRDAQLYLALTESGLATRVQAGENRGATLRNDHVVRDWVGPLPLDAPAKVQLGVEGSAATAGATAARRAVVAFVQETQSGEVLQAMRLPLGSCAP